MEVQAKAGEAFDIKVEQLGTAGYQWLVEPLPPGVTLAEQRTTPPPPGAPPGSSGEQVFTFRADGPGEFEIVLASKRAWEAQPATRQTFRVKVS